MTSLPYFPEPPQNYVAAGPPLLSCGLDLGQRHDPTALAVLEAADLMATTPDPVTWERAQVRHFGLRHLERLPLGTPYTEVAARVRDVLLALRQAGRVTLTVDATGVGAPVVDVLRREFARSGFSG